MGYINIQLDDELHLKLKLEAIQEQVHLKDLITTILNDSMQE